MTEIRTILVLGIITALLTGAASAMMTTTQTAEARINSNPDGTRSGGEGSKHGGGGFHRDCTVFDPEFGCEGSGGGGQNSGGELGTVVGGGGRHVECDSLGCSSVGGSGQHLKGPGGNSGN